MVASTELAVEVVQRVAAGGLHLDAKVLEAVFKREEHDQLKAMTPRETEVPGLLARSAPARGLELCSNTTDPAGTQVVSVGSEAMEARQEPQTPEAQAKES